MNIEHADGDTTVLTRGVGDEFETMLFFLSMEGVPQTAILGRHVALEQAREAHRAACAKYLLLDDTST